jgi:hypothetical protein
MRIDEQVKKMLDLVIERKLKLNKLEQIKCLDNEEDKEDKMHIEKTKQTYIIEECCCTE